SGAAATNYSSVLWTVVTGNGSLTNANTLTPTYTPVAADAGTTVTLRLTTNGNAPCASASDEMIIDIETAPAVNAGSDAETCVNLAYTVSGASASNYSSVLWTVIAGGGTLTNETTLTPEYTPVPADEGTIVTLRLTATGNANCAPVTDDMDIQIVAAPLADAGSDGQTCGNAAFTVSGAAASNYSSILWTIVSGAGSLIDENILTPTYTPAAADAGTTVVLKLTVNGNANCAAAIDEMNIDVIDPPTVDAGENITECYGSDVQLNGSASNYGIIYWSTITGDGAFDDEYALDAIYTPGPNDLMTGTVMLYLTATGGAVCADVTDSVIITIPPKLIATIGKPTPFYIGPNTAITISAKVENHQAIHDLSYFLQAPDGTRVPLKIANNFLTCNYGDGADLTFTNNPADDTLDICTVPFFPGTTITGTYRATGDFSTIYGMDPANGAWSVLITDCDYNVFDPTDGFLTAASITFTDTAFSGHLETVAYESGTINEPIVQNQVSGCGETSYISPLGLRTRCFETCDAIGLVTVVGGTPPYVDYQWSPLPDGGNGTDSVALCKGTYTLTVTDALGCIAITTVEVSSPPRIEFKSFEYTDSLICGGLNQGVIATRATGGTGKLTYTLQPGNIASSVADSGRFENLAGGTYTIRVEDINGCFRDTTVSIFEPEGLQLDSVSVDSIKCNSDLNGVIRVFASGGSQPYTFWISPGSEVNNDGVFENLGEGNYTISFTDANNCDTLSTALISLVAPTELKINVVTVEHAVCHDGTGSLRLFVAGGSTPYETSVDSGATYIPGLEISDLAAGIYYVAVKDRNGCTDFYDSSVVIINPPVISIDSLSVEDITGCYGDSTGQIYIRASGGWGKFEYSVDGQPYTTSNLLTNLGGGTQVLNISDSLGCVLTIDTITIAQPSAILVETIVTPITGGQQSNLTINATGGTPPYQYSIDSGAVFQDANLFTSLDAGTYYIAVRDSRGCTVYDTVNIIAKLLEVEILDYKDVSCFGFSDGGFTVLIKNGTQPYNVTITNTASSEISREVIGYDQDVFSDENFEAGSYNIRIVDSQAQIYDSTFIITQPTPIIPTVVAQNSSCQDYIHDGSINITSTGGGGQYTYRWDDDINLTDSIRNNLSPKNYIVTVSDANGCSVTTEIIIDYDQESIMAYAGMDTIICAYTEYMLKGIAFDYDSTVWSFSEDDPVFEFEESIYIVDPRNINSYMSTNRKINLLLNVYKNGCYGKDTVTIDIHPILDLTLYEYGEEELTEMDTLIYLSEGESYPFWALFKGDLIPGPSFKEYFWSPIQGLQIDTLGRGIVTATSDSISYSISGTSIYGCVDSVKLIVLMLRDLKLFSGFTPNDDGINDRWIIENAEGYDSKIEVRIFNRWGELVFRSVGYDESKAWDGKFNGKEMPIGTYYYIIDVKDSNLKPLTGSITLIR
ncbi:MAG: gliding motility-associated C-terminal domain-containing protein, partial [Bacteroidales bacterium]|nr:gliding motility-associated C-terminal domain-containing protein [Bacteroidales bacterium]